MPEFGIDELRLKAKLTRDIVAPGMSSALRETSYGTRARISLLLFANDDHPAIYS
ncbi:MAG: hypothetical protein ACRYG8_36845 [Janthinobacterium lividum]